MSGPLSILYGDESADELPGFVDQPGGCDKINRCNDHVARTDGRISGFTDDEKSFRNYFVSLMRLPDAAPKSTFIDKLRRRIAKLVDDVDGKDDNSTDL